MRARPPTAARPLTAALLAMATLFSALPFAGPAGAPPPCAPASPVWILGAVYDAAQRDDFEVDVDNFEYYVAQLRLTYCIPDSQVAILAFENNYTRHAKTYPAATEANVRDQLAAFGAAASAQPGSLFVYLQSSHGNFYAASSCGGQLRSGGSLAYLKSGGGHDGNFRDCDLGALLGAHVAPATRMLVLVDCSFCGGFSDSLTAASGTVPDGSLPVSSGVPGPNRVVVTGCAVTTECFGSGSGGAGGGTAGGVSYKHLTRVLQGGMAACDGWTGPAFPAFQGIDAPVPPGVLVQPDGQCTASEWFWAAVRSAYLDNALFDRAIGIQQQFRIKYGFATLAEDIRIR